MQMGNYISEKQRGFFSFFQSFGGKFGCKWVSQYISEKSKRRTFTVS